MDNKLFTRKPLADLLAQADESEKGLKRTLGATSLVALGIGAIIGAGLFSITGGAAANNAGPAVTISFIIAAIGCAFAGLCYAEFASMIPVAGSAYTYSYATMGELIAWIIGWDLVLEYAVGGATVAISWSRYFVKILHNFGIEFPAQLAASPWDSTALKYETMINGVLHHKGEVITGILQGGTLVDNILQNATLTQGLINLPAIFVVIGVSALLIKGTHESALVTSIIVSLKVAVVLIFIALGWGYINADNLVPYIPENTGEFGAFGWSGIVRAAGIIFFAYIGFDAVSTAAQEAKNPGRDMPIGILLSLAICTVLYLLFAHVMTGVVSYKAFAGQDGIAPVAVAIENMGSMGPNGKIIPDFPWLNNAIIIAILAGYFSVILVMLMGQSRVFFSMAEDGLLPKVFSEVHPKFKTPWKSNLLIGALVCLFAGFVPSNVVGEMTSIGTLLAFVLVCVGILVMRKTMPNEPRVFKTPFVPVVPILGALVCLAMMAGLPLDTWLRLIIWMGLGFVIYFYYGRKHSKLNNK